MKNILVAIDSIDPAIIESSLMKQAIEVAGAFSSKVKILHVAPQSRQVPFNIDRNILRCEAAHKLQDEHKSLQQLAECLRDRDIEATSLLVEGATIETILHESDRLGIDLIILGCHRHNELYEALMNGTEGGVLGKCAYPVMFIPMQTH